MIVFLRLIITVAAVKNFSQTERTYRKAPEEMMTMQDGFRFAELSLDRLLDFRLAVVSFLVLTVLTHFTLSKSILRRVREHKDVPEPPAWPIIGHLHLFGKLPHQLLMKLARRYGPLMSIRLGAIRVIVASDAAMAKEFLKTLDPVWASRPPTLFGEIFFYNHSGQILQPYNDLFRRMKKVYVSELLSPAASGSEKQKDQRHESLTHMVNSLLASHRENKLIDVHVSVCNMNYDHMTKLIFTKRLSLESTVKKRTLVQTIRNIAMIDFLSLGECFPRLRWLDVDGVEGKLKKLHGEYDSAVTELLEERRRQLSDGEEDDDSRDFSRALLSLLNKEDGTGLTYNQIKAAIADIYAGGIETSAGLATFATAEIVRHPEIKRKLVKELDDIVGHERVLKESDLASCSYLKMVVKETLRLHPPIPLLVPHQSTAPCVVAGYYIPANTQLLVNVYAIQRDPKSWEDPLAFKPERFSDSSVDPKGQHFEYLPFGTGRRQCPGMSGGVTMSELILARLFHSFDISPPPGMKPEDVDTTEKTGVTMSLATPLRLVMSPRLPQNLYSM